GLWQRWAGSTNPVTVAFSTPTNDWRLFDLFTTAINDNATRGQLSVNQDKRAAWSAVLSGVLAMPALGSSSVIQPAAVSPELARIVDGINRTRTNDNPLVGPVFRNHVFQ